MNRIIGVNARFTPVDLIEDPAFDAAEGEPGVLSKAPPPKGWS
jgi:hypothetical protein